MVSDPNKVQDSSIRRKEVILTFCYKVVHENMFDAARALCTMHNFGCLRGSCETVD